MKNNLMIIIIALLTFIIGYLFASGLVSNIAVVIFIVGVVRMICKENWVLYSVSAVFLVGGISLYLITTLRSLAVILICLSVVIGFVPLIRKLVGNKEITNKK